MSSDFQNIACGCEWILITPYVHAYVKSYFEPTLDQMGRVRLEIQGTVQRVSSDDGLARWHLKLYGSGPITSIDLLGEEYSLNAAMTWVEFMTSPDKENAVPAALEEG